MAAARASLPGLRAVARLHAFLSVGDRADSAGGAGHPAVGVGLERILAAVTAPRVLAALAAFLRHRRDRGRHQYRSSASRRLGAGALPFSRQATARRADRSALRAADRGRGHRAVARSMRRNGWLGAPLAWLGIKIAYHAAGRGGGADLHRPALRRAHVAAGAGRSGPRAGRSRRHAGRDTRLQTFRRVVLPTLAPAILTGAALAFARAVGEYGSVIFIAGNLPMRVGDRAAADRHQAGAIRLRRRRRHRRGDAGGVLRHAAGAQWLAGLGGENRDENKIARRHRRPSV